MATAMLKEKCNCTPVGGGNRKCGHNDLCKILRQFANNRYLIQDSAGFVRAVDPQEITIMEW